VAFLGVAFFLGVVAFAAAFFGAAFLAAFGAAGAVVLVTRPDLVLPRTRDTSASTAAAGAAVLRGLLALALGFAAAAAAFLGAAFAVVVFLGAAFFVVVVVVVALAVYMNCEHAHGGDLLVRLTVAVAFLGAAAFFSVVFFSVLDSAFFAAGAAAAGFASFFASFTVPEAPRQYVRCVSLDIICV
jgi:hypothetical protein